MFPIVRYRMTFPTSLLAQLQLWHVQWRVFIRSWATCVHKYRTCCTSWLKEILLQSSKNISVWITSTAHISVYQHQSDYHKHRGLKHVAVFSSCIPWSFNHNWALLYNACLTYMLQGVLSLWQITPLRRVLPYRKVTCISEGKRLRTYIVSL